MLQTAGSGTVDAGGEAPRDLLLVQQAWCGVRVQGARPRLPRVRVATAGDAWVKGAWGK